MKNQWLDDSFHGVNGISVYNQSTRTNNDCEGWHLRLKTRAFRDHLGLYQLISLLHKEAKLSIITATLVYLQKDTKMVKKKYRINNEKIYYILDTQKIT